MRSSFSCSRWMERRWRKSSADTLRGEPDRALLDIAASARGNPFLLVELLAGLREEELVRVDRRSG